MILKISENMLGTLSHGVCTASIDKRVLCYIRESALVTKTSCADVTQKWRGHQK